MSAFFKDLSQVLYGDEIFTSVYSEHLHQSIFVDVASWRYKIFMLSLFKKVDFWLV
jgi:hypothetical protein